MPTSSNGQVVVEAEPTSGGEHLLSLELPFIWPEARFYAGVARYPANPPLQNLFADAELISGLLVGAADEAVEWLTELISKKAKRRISLVCVLTPAGPTRAEHLRAIAALRAACEGSDVVLDVRVLPMTRLANADCERSVLPPSVLQAHSPATGTTIMSLGSVGDAGFDKILLGSFNFVFRPDDAMRDAWRKWFQYVFTSAAPLTEATIDIPHLVPAKGDPDAALLWQSFVLTCQGDMGETKASPTVDPTSGEVTAEADGKKVDPWDKGATALDPLAQVFQQVYASGWLVTVDEATRIKPLTIPVKATLLGQQSERNVGALKQKQSFTLKVLDDEVDKAIEKCRKVTDVMELLTYPLSQGNRWLPDAAKCLLEKEIEARNQEGQKVLRAALGTGDVKQFIAARTEAIRKDLNDMYQQLGQGKAVPPDKLKSVLDEIELRLTKALGARITPRAVYNRIGAPDLTINAPDDNWNQPLSMLLRSARMLRESLTDSYFPRRFSGLSFTEAEFRQACNVFGDQIVVRPDTSRAKDELRIIDEITAADKPAKTRCKEVWCVVTGAELQPEDREKRGDQ
jgi:hypothetical protein